MKDNTQKQRSYVPLLLLEQILAQMLCPVASSEALNLLHWAMCTGRSRRIAMAFKTANKVGIFFHCCLFACCPGSSWGNMEQVVDQWRHKGASSVALDLLHWAMLRQLLQHICMAIEMASRGGGLFQIVNFCLDINVAKGPCYGQFKLTP